MFNNTPIIKIMTETTTIVSAVESILDEKPIGAVCLRRPGWPSVCLTVEARWVTLTPGSFRPQQALYRVLLIIIDRYAKVPRNKEGIEDWVS